MAFEVLPELNIPFVGGKARDENGNILDIQTASIEITTNTITELIAASASFKARVLKIFINCVSTGAQTIAFNNGDDTTQLFPGSGTIDLGGTNVPRMNVEATAPPGGFLFENGTANDAVRVDPGGNPSTGIRVEVWYVLVPV